MLHQKWDYLKIGLIIIVYIHILLQKKLFIISNNKYKIYKFFIMETTEAVLLIDI